MLCIGQPCRAGEPSLWGKGTPSTAAAAVAAEREKLAEGWATLEAAKNQLRTEQQALVNEKELTAAATTAAAAVKAAMVDCAVQCPVDASSVEAELLQAEAETLIREVEVRTHRSGGAVRKLDTARISRGGHPRRAPPHPPAHTATATESARRQDVAISAVTAHRQREKAGVSSEPFLPKIDSARGAELATGGAELATGGAAAIGGSASLPGMPRPRFFNAQFSHAAAFPAVGEAVPRPQALLDHSRRLGVA